MSGDSTEVKIYRSLWWTCGLKYQEVFLIRRRLVFTEFQAYFQSLEMDCLEEPSLELTSIPRFSSLLCFSPCFQHRGIG